MNKKVLHFRLDAPQYSSEFMRKGFIEAGYEYHGMNWQAVKFNEGVLGFQARAIEAARQIQPDLIFLHIQSGQILDIETCQDLTAIGFTVLYTFDVREDVAWMKELEPYLNMILVSDGETTKEFPIGKSFVLPSSCDMEMYSCSYIKNYKLLIPDQFKIKEYHYPPICFIGSNYVNTNLNFPLANERYEMVTELEKEYGDKFLYKGMNWTISEYVPPAQEVFIYNNSKIAISHNNFYRPLYTSDRLYRIMACGCFCLSKYFPGIEQMFIAGEHLDWWHNFDELKDKINYYISNDEVRDRIAKAGYEFVKFSYSWVTNVRIIESLIDQTKNVKHGQSESREAV